MLESAIQPVSGARIGRRIEERKFAVSALLLEQGVETSASVLDVGCGDLEVVRSLNLKNYLGLDTSERAIETAKGARPDWAFRHVGFNHCHEPTLCREAVLCFEVLIHQRSEADYWALIRFLADCTERTPLVSGCGSDYEGRAENSMVYFYEALDEPLRKTGKFRSVRPVGHIPTSPCIVAMSKLSRSGVHKDAGLKGGRTHGHAPLVVQMG